jgi:hypothetical protein
VTWISIRERTPKHGQKVILRCRYATREMVTLGYRRNKWAGGFCTQRIGGGMAVEMVTHWMPFPKINRSSTRATAK